ncbi:MAG: NfeD family protein [Actinomycetota bacterium]
MGATAAIAAAALLTGLAGVARPQTGQPVIASVELTGVVDPIIADHITSVIQRANGDHDAAVLLTIDTPGGLGSSMDQIDEAILNSSVPVIGYVAPSGARAASAGAFVLMSCPVAAMAPGTNVGASTPIGLSGGDLANKVTNDAAASMRKLAQTYGRNPDVAESFVTSATSITAQEAYDQGVIEYLAASQDDLLAQVDGEMVTLANGTTVTMRTAGAAIEEEPLGGFFGFLHTLLDPDLAFIFFWLGLGLVILELIVPGHIFSGTLGTILLILAFVSFGVLPVRIIGIALLVLSVVAFILELKAPGFGVWGVTAIIALLLGGWFLYDRAGGVEVSPGVLVGVAVFAGLFFGLVVVKALSLRHTPPAQLRPIVGADGVAIAPIGPNGGLVRVSAEEWQAVSPGNRIREGTPIHVTSIDGLVLTVEAITGEHAPAGQRAPASEGGNPA